MKIIQVVGESNAGKTSFIKQLIPALEKRGRVAVIKHLGDHEFSLEKGKDTTQFFEAGATISIGIDANKSVAAIRAPTLDGILRLLDHEGIDYIIIEGFKTCTFPKIVIGDLPMENCVVSNPTVNEVLSSLHRFEDYPPMKGTSGIKHG